MDIISSLTSVLQYPRPLDMSSLKPFDGSLRKLVLAFDVGTTFSGVGYAVLDPGMVPQIQVVNRYTSFATVCQRARP